MKITISLLLLFCLFIGMEIQAQEVDITGTWTMYEMIRTTEEGVNKTTEDQLKDEGAISEYSFMPDGKLKHINNMTGTGKLENMEGNWKLEGEILTVNFILDGHPVDLTLDFEFRDEAIHLTWTSADGAGSIVSSFKRK